MNRAEKILKAKKEFTDLFHLLDQSGEHFVLDAMREIAWEAWKKSVNLMWGMFTPKGEEMAKEEFNEWYNEKEK